MRRTCRAPGRRPCPSRGCRRAWCRPRRRRRRPRSTARCRSRRPWTSSGIALPVGSSSRPRIPGCPPSARRPRAAAAVPAPAPTSSPEVLTCPRTVRGDYEVRGDVRGDYVNHLTVSFEPREVWPVGLAGARGGRRASGESTAAPAPAACPLAVGARRCAPASHVRVTRPLRSPPRCAVPPLLSGWTTTTTTERAQSTSWRSSGSSTAWS